MPTHITSKSATPIGHIYYYEGKNSRRGLDITSGNLLNDMTDHLPNFTLIISDRPKNKNVSRQMIRLFSQANKECFMNDLTHTGWSKLYLGTDVNKAYDIFYSEFQMMFNKNFPFVTLSKQRAKDKNWITSALKISSRHKNKLHKMWSTTKKTEDEVDL
jgi:hypothetical protein